MANRLRRYLWGSLSGAAVVGASVAGLHVLQPSVPEPDAASIGGPPAARCTVQGDVTSCSQSAPAPDSSSLDAAVSRDGVYEAAGRYLTPGGAESIGVSLTLVGGVITETSVEVEATSPTARQFQVQFASRYADRVVAKEISHLSLSRVAGASLTSVGFNDALAQIMVESRV